jgi:3-oxoacyl-[acyl-carrier protein] reductase
VTGASRGIGLGIAKVFADAGANVLICGRDKQAMRDALDSLHEATGEIDTRWSTL